MCVYLRYAEVTECRKMALRKNDPTADSIFIVTLPDVEASINVFQFAKLVSLVSYEKCLNHTFVLCLFFRLEIIVLDSSRMKIQNLGM